MRFFGMRRLDAAFPKKGISTGVALASISHMLFVTRSVSEGGYSTSLAYASDYKNAGCTDISWLVRNPG